MKVKKRCQGCGEMNEGNLARCESCGNELQNKSVKKPSDDLFTWWEVDSEKILKEASEYKDTSFWKSSRGAAVIAMCFIVLINGVLIVSGILGLSAYSFIDVGIFTILSIFVFRGQRWAIVGTMIFWTLEKTFSVALGIFAIVAVGGSGNIFGQIILPILWWAIFMKIFYQAYKVEAVRNGIEKKGESCEEDSTAIGKKDATP